MKARFWALWVDLCMWRSDLWTERARRGRQKVLAALRGRTPSP